MQSVKTFFLRLLSAKSFAVILLLLVVSVACAQPKERETQPIRIISVDVAPYPESDERYLVAEQWGIELYSMPGCFMSKQVSDSISHFNDSTFQLVEQKFGAGWKTRFNDEIDALRKKNEKLKQLVGVQEIVRKKVEECEATDCSLDYKIQPSGKAEQYIVSLVGYLSIDGKRQEVTYYTFLVNNKTGKVKRLN